MKLAPRLVALSLLGWLIFAIAPHALAQTYQGKQLVRAELLADTKAIVPGKPITVGLLLRMAPGWHTYWKFSGDAGLPTELNWKLPPGWKVGDIQWPIPLKTIDPGDIETYGYQDEVLLMQKITSPLKLDVSSVQLAAEANWLVCEKICIPGSAILRLDLPVASSSEPANADVFARYRRLVPQNWPGPNVATASWSRVGSELRVKISSEMLAKSPPLDFFPLPEQDTIVGHPAVQSRNNNEIVFRIPLESAPKNLSSIAGLVVFAQQPNGEHRAGWQIGSGSAAAQTGLSSLPPAHPAPAHGVFMFLFFGFLGGIILNLMPCVLPVISLKIFGFVQQAGESRQKIFRSGIASSLGIFVWFIALAVLL